jgi:hypothetical protein
MKKNNLKIGTAKNKTEYIEKYKEGIFDVVEAVYAPLYGVVPYSERVRSQLISNFKLFLNFKIFRKQ